MPMNPWGRTHYILLGLLASIFFVNFLSRIVLAPLMPVIENDLGLGHTAAGAFFMMIASGYSIGLIGSGFLSSRLTHRRTVALAAVACGCAFFIIAAGQTLWMIRFSLFFVGFSTGIYLPSGITTITSSISSEHWGRSIAVHELAPTFAYISAPLLVEALLLVFPWQMIFALIGGVSVLLGLTFLRINTGGDLTGDAPTIGNIRLLICKPAFWIMTSLFILAIASTVGIYSMIPLYLVAERNFDRNLANTLLGLSRIPVIAMIPLCGWISDRFGAKPTITVVTLFNGITTILLAALPGRLVVLMLFVQPILSVFFFTAGFSALSFIVEPRARHLSVSLTVFISYLIGAGLIPTVLGVFGDAGMFSFAFILVGIVNLLCLLPVGSLDLTEPEENDLSIKGA